ncbi:regulator of chromosome condensation [Mytilus galloprovincialis]|nr:regulator of chromosome condensation [Mytilus galloprovincialis]
MPGRGKKRGRPSDSSEVTPDAKKRAIPKEDEKKKVKVTHHTHPDFTVPGIPLTLGEGDVGQLGLGEDVMERMRPAVVKLDDKIVQVCAGGMHTVCLTNKGEIITFGCNDESGLGRDTSEEGSETYPAKLDLSYKVIQVSAGDSHTAILTEDGHVYAWGNFRDANGSMGLTSGGIRKDPLEMCPGETVVKIVSGGDHLVCLTNKGEIFTGGCAEQGQLGRVAECFAGRGSRRGVDSILKMGPVRCKKHGSRKHARFSDIWAGQYVTFAKEKESGDIYSWGLNNYFQIGFDDMQNRFTPEWVPSFAAHNKKWTKIQAGQHHTMLLDEEGKVYTIGRAEYGRLGLGEDSGEKREPTLVKTLTEKCTDIAAGQSVSLALTEHGPTYLQELCWLLPSSRYSADDSRPWLMSHLQLLAKNYSTSWSLEAVVKTFFRTVCCLPRHLFYTDSFTEPMIDEDFVLSTINGDMREGLEDGCLFPSNVFSYLVQGMILVKQAIDIDKIFTSCPIMLTSLMVYLPTIRYLIEQVTFRNGNLVSVVGWLKRALEGHFPSFDDCPPWMYAVAMLSLCINRDQVEDMISQFLSQKTNKNSLVLKEFVVILTAHTAYQDLDEPRFCRVLDVIQNSSPDMILALPNESIIKQMCSSSTQSIIPYRLLMYISRGHYNHFKSIPDFLGKVLSLYSMVVNLCDEKNSGSGPHLQSELELSRFVQKCIDTSPDFVLKDLDKDLVKKCGMEITLAVQERYKSYELLRKQEKN